MPLVADRVAETTTTTGTGTVTLAGAKTGYQAFTTAFSTGAKVYYCITDNTNWEVGVGTFTTVGTTLSRDSIFASSNAGAAVNWGAGSKDVFCTAPMQSVVGAPRLQAKTGAYTVVASDNGSIINCTSGTFTVALTAAATLGSGFTCWVWNTSNTTSDAITIDPNASETIDGRSTLILRRGEGCQIVCDGTNWQTGDKKTMRGYAENISATQTRPEASADSSIAIGVNARAQSQYSIALGDNTTSTTSAGVAIGRFALVTASDGVAIQNSRANGSLAFAACISSDASFYGGTNTNATAIGQISAASSQAVAIGPAATASGTNSVAIGGTTSSVNTASATGSTALGGSGNTASASYAFAFGYQAQSTIIGKYAYASGRFSVNGDAQIGTSVLRRTTTDATATVLTTNNTTPGADDQVILSDNSAYAFTGIVVARRQASGGTASAAWKIEGLIRREGSAATTTLIVSTVTAIDNTPGWTLALSADTTNGGLAITATGAAATNIRWVATVQTSEVIYA